MAISEILSYVSLIAYVAAFASYNRNIITEKVTSNKITWALWALLTTLNALTYAAMSGDVTKSLLVYFGGMLNLITTVILWRKSGKVAIPHEDWLICAMCLVAILAWLLTREAMYGNIILQVALIISFVPLMKTVIKEPGAERPLPWFLFALAYFIMLLVVLARYKQPQDVIAPVVCLLMHGAMGVLALPGARRGTHAGSLPRKPERPEMQ